MAVTKSCHPQTLRQMRWANAMLLYFVTVHGSVIAVRDRVQTPISLEGDSTREPLRDRPRGEDRQILQEVVEVLGRQQ